MEMICVASVHDIQEGCSRGIEYGNHYLFAVKKDDQVYLYRNRCPHLGTPLEWEEDRFLDSDGALIQCSTHGALFQIETGHCLAGPCQGKYLQAVPFIVDSGLMMVEEIYLPSLN
ncbi:MAG: Rieske (2Fe-2S) protein [Pseudohongiellaceae bacterium]